ncbi:hypothetical protein LIER_33602 [Lithospermum erythrorhizon]|uniref:Pentatricopeptide repeat-containing protein n=1 Tax=Lithospermum erythrorhizon TaxID=34254 RepID=A0AAV3RZE7_LITER
MSTASTPSFLSQNDVKLPSPKLTQIPSTIPFLQMCHKFQEIKQVHAQLIVSGLIHHKPNTSRLLESYVSMSQFQDACKLFNSIKNPDSFAYNATIRALILDKCPDKSIYMFHDLLSNGIIPDSHTYTFILKACSKLKVLSEGKQIHCLIIKNLRETNSFINSSLVHMYSNSNDMESAKKVVDGLVQEDVLASNALVTGYLNQGQVEVAKKLFDKMVTKNDASWSIMSSGYTKNGMYEEALIVFAEMLAFEIVVNEAGLVSALSACTHLGNLEKGMYIHKYINMNVVKVGTKLLTALVEMYGKCGWLEGSYQVFEAIPRKDVVSWGTIISCFAFHGQPEKCFELFDRMVSSGVLPNEVVFVSILTACSHSGLVEQGCHYFVKMVNGFEIRPSVEHYGCMVDLLGRVKRLSDAEELISTMLQPPNKVIWGTLLNACRLHSDYSTGRRVYQHLTEMEKLVGDRYKLAARMFDEMGEVEDANDIRKFTSDKNLHSRSGLSMIVVDGDVHNFMVGDISHQKSKEIYHLLMGQSRYTK